MLEIDGSRYSGSGAIVRQAVGFAALTGTAMHWSVPVMFLPAAGFGISE
jgi:hypothetical protein